MSQKIIPHQAGLKNYGSGKGLKHSVFDEFYITPPSTERRLTSKMNFF
jgi:hypothetical protein